MRRNGKTSRVQKIYFAVPVKQSTRNPPPVTEARDAQVHRNRNRKEQTTGRSQEQKSGKISCRDFYKHPKEQFPSPLLLFAHQSWKAYLKKIF